MLSRYFLIFSGFTLLNLFISCSAAKPEVERAFYYWKSNEYSLEKEETNLLRDLQVQKLYLKFFEVHPDIVFDAVPAAKTSVHIWNYSVSQAEDSLLAKTMNNLEIVPTVFIKNTALENISEAGIDSLADNINFLVNKYFKERIKSGAKLNEIQLDCDWTAGTKDRYFRLLTTTKKLSGKLISCTLRLYPFRYPEKMGIPPVDRVTLMCYNLLNPLESDSKNSILDTRELESYLKGSKDYPIHTDIALPAFSWMQVYQNNQFAGIIDPENPDLQPVIKKVSELWYEVQQDIVIDDLYLRIGDKLKLEDVNEKTLSESITLLKKHLKFDEKVVVSFFHLDTKNLSKFNNEKLSDFYSDFAK